MNKKSKVSVKNGGFPPIKYLNPNEIMNKSLETSRLIDPIKKTVNIKELLTTKTASNSFNDEDDVIEIKEF